MTNGSRPSPKALHEAFYERTIVEMTEAEFRTLTKVEDRAHAIDAELAKETP